MKRILPWLLLPYLTLSQADNTDSASLANMLGQVSEEAAQTTLENIKTESPKAVTKDEPVVKSKAADVDQLTQSIAKRLAEILGTKPEAGSELLSMNLESIVSSALHDGKKMDEIRSAVEQAMTEITGQALQLNPDVLKIEQEMATQSGQKLTPAPSVADKKVGTALTTPAADASSAQNIQAQSDPNDPSITTENTTTVLPGESLFRVAQRIYGKENGNRFLDIFEANKDVIDNIHVVIEGQVLKLP